eukprot:6165639-Prymnesium_polylepis.1
MFVCRVLVAREHTAHEHDAHLYVLPVRTSVQRVREAEAPQGRVHIGRPSEKRLFGDEDTRMAQRWPSASRPARDAR